MSALTAPDDSAKHPTKPRFALAVGVVGHRPGDRLRAEDTAQVTAHVAAILAALARAAQAAMSKHAAGFAAGAPLLSLVSALAEGADRIAAEAALAAHFALDVALPFPVEEYKKDFKAEASKDQFGSLRQAARAELVLPGTRKDADDPNDPEAKKAYEAVGFTVLNQCDIVLAIWDGGPSKGRGGTTEMVNAAARLGLPIIHVDTRGKEPPAIRWNGLKPYPPPVNAAEDIEPTAFDQKQINTLVEALVRLPKPSADRHGFLRPHHDEASALAAYYSERFCRLDFWLLHRLPYQLLLLAAWVRGFRSNEIWPQRPSQLAEDWRQLASPALPPGADQPKRLAASRPDLLVEAYGWADSVATRFALTFRGAFVLNFLLAAAAVIVAACSLITVDPAKPGVLSHLVGHKMPFVGAELALIAVVLINTFAGLRGRCHPRWIEPREVAERLRVALPLWMLGARPASFPGEEPTWTGWYARAIARAQGLRNVTFEPAALIAARDTLMAVLNNQRDYHRSTTGRMDKLDRHLEFAGLLLFGLTAVAALTFLAAAAIGAELSPWSANAVTAVAAGLPALATALYGIRIIGDFDGIARRAARMLKELDGLVVAMEADWPKDGRSAAPNFARLYARAQAAAGAMLGDVQSWRLAAESRELTVPS